MVGYDGSEAARLAVEGAADELDPDGKLVVVCSAGPRPELSGAFDLKRVVASTGASARGPSCRPC